MTATTPFRACKEGNKPLEVRVVRGACCDSSGWTGFWFWKSACEACNGRGEIKDSVCPIHAAAWPYAPPKLNLLPLPRLRADPRRRSAI